MTHHEAVDWHLAAAAKTLGKTKSFHFEQAGRNLAASQSCTGEGCSYGHDGRSVPREALSRIIGHDGCGCLRCKVSP